MRAPAHDPYAALDRFLGRAFIVCVLAGQLGFVLWLIALAAFIAAGWLL